MSGGGSGAVATDAIWDAPGDLAVGTGANTAARLAIGNAGGAVSRVNGAVAWNSGTGFPTAAAGDRFWRTDRGLEYYYDGTRWLTTTLFTIPTSMTSSISVAADNGNIGVFGLMPASHGIWLATMYMTTYVATTNNGSNFWTVTLTQGSNGASLGNFTTASDSANTYTEHTIVVDATTTEKLIYPNPVNTGAPGAIFPAAQLSFRLVG
jgi:hypothetical protein